MQGRGRGQLSFHKALPVTAPSTIASVTYDDPNGSWENWEPGASWNGTGGGGHEDAPGPSSPAGSQHTPPRKNDGELRWDEDSDTNLRHPNKQAPGTLITMSELDWEDTEELATELWRHPMRPRISRDAHAAQRQPTRNSPVRPDPRHLPMPLPGPGGARPHARSEDPTARLRMSGPNVLTRTGAQPRVDRNAPPQSLPAAPPPRAELGEPERRTRTTTQPGAAPQTAAEFASPDTNSTSMPEDWLTGTDVDSLPSYSSDSYSERMPPEAFMPPQPPAAYPSRPAPQVEAASKLMALPPTAAGRFASPRAPHPSAAGRYSPQHSSARPAPTASPVDRWQSTAAAPSLRTATPLPPPAAGAAQAPSFAPQTTGLQRRGSLIRTRAADSAGGPPAQLPPAPPPRPSLPAEPLTQTQGFGAQLPPAPPPRPSLASEPYSQMQGFGAQLPPTPAPRPSSASEPYSQTQGFGAQLPPAPAPRPGLPAEPLTQTQGFGAQLPPAPAPRPSLASEPYSQTQGFGAQLPPAPVPRAGLPAEPQTQGFGAQLPPAPPPRPSLASEPYSQTQGFGAQLPPAPPPRPSLASEPYTQTQGFGTQLPPTPAPRPSLASEPFTRTQAFEAHAPAAPPIESLRERTMTPSRLLPPPPRFPSSAHIPTIIGTPAASSAPALSTTRGQSSLMQSGSRLHTRTGGRDAFTAPPPPAAQSQLIEQLQEQLLEAMARARVQEARAAEAEKSVEQAEEQLAAVARGHSEETVQLEQQLLQLSEQLEAAERRAAQAERRPHQSDNMLHLAEADLVQRPNKQGRANLILSGLLASSLSFGGAAYFMFYAPLQKQLAGVEQLRTQDSQAHATAVSNLQARSTAEKQGLEAQNAELRKQLEAAKAEASAASAPAEDPRRGRGRRGAEADDGTPAGTRSARAIERRMRRSRAAAQGDSDDAEAPRARKSAPSRDDSNDPLGGI